MRRKTKRPAVKHTVLTQAQKNKADNYPFFISFETVQNTKLFFIALSYMQKTGKRGVFVSHWVDGSYLGF
jgi:hypothetical protein